MAQRKLLIAAGLVTFLAGTLMTLPARLVSHWFAPDQIRFSGVTGTIWRGQAAEGSANGAYFSDLMWTYKPSQLFSGKLAFDTSVNTVAGPIQGNVSLAINNVFYIRDLTGNLNIAQLHPTFLKNRIDGQLNIDFQSVALRNGFPASAEGLIGVSGLVVGMFGSAPIGDFDAVINDNENGISAVVKDAGAVITLNGTILLDEDRSYLFTGKIGATPDTPPQINQNFQFLGSPDASGLYDFRFEGTL